MLPRNHRMELLSKAYVRAVVAQAGFSCDDVHSDFGIDLTVRNIAQRDGRFVDLGPLVDLQLKSTTFAGIRVTNKQIHYDLSVKNYNDLRMENINRQPRLLVLFVMPDGEEEWLTQTEEATTLRHCAYYVSLVGAPATQNERTVSVAIPENNLFNAKLLDDLAAKGERL